MTHPNRVQPDGSFLAVSAQGGFMGNRGRLHDAAGRVVRRWSGKAWITCTLRVKPGRVPPGVLPQRGYTRLFFHDEAVACAAGHRPCAECRRPAYDDFCHAWAEAFGKRSLAGAMNEVLHAARIDSTTRGQRRHLAEAGSLPSGTFILWHGAPHLVCAQGLMRFNPAGYAPALPIPDALLPVLTPEPIVAVLRAGWQPAMSAAEDRPGW